jgi:hypothetical protein
MTTIVEILPSAKKLYSSSSWKSRRPTVSSSEAPQVRVRLGEKFVARLIASLALEMEIESVGNRIDNRELIEDRGENPT